MEVTVTPETLERAFWMADARCNNQRMAPPLRFFEVMAQCLKGEQIPLPGALQGISPP
jgi:hypothetical protein